MKLKEKAQVEFNCKTIGELINVLNDIQSVMGKNTKIGKINNLNPSIDVQLFNYDNPIVILN